MFSDCIIDCGNTVRAMEFASEFRLPDKNIRSTSLLAVGMIEGGIKIWNVNTGILSIKPLAEAKSTVSNLSH